MIIRLSHLSPICLVILLGYSPMTFAQFAQDEFAIAQDALDAEVNDLIGFVKDVALNETDINSIVVHQGTIETIAERFKRKAWYLEADDGLIIFVAMLRNKEYKAWAKAEGLDPELWLKKFVRVQLLLMKQDLAGSRLISAPLVEAQLVKLESQRAQMGEEMFQRMTDTLTMSAKVMGSINDAYSGMPGPTPAEVALLQLYRTQLADQCCRLIPDDRVVE